MYPSQTFDFEHDGRDFRATIHADDCGDAPWERDDGHGVVSEWTTREKRPGERLLNADRHSKRFYDVQASIALARRDGWGVSPETLAEMTRVHGRAPTAKEIAAAAVERDFDFLRGWCADDWSYIGVAVQPLDDDGEPFGGEFDFALWGIESNADDYIREVAAELASQVPVPDHKDTMRTLATQMHALAFTLHGTEVPADISKRLTDLADDMQQIAGA